MDELVVGIDIGGTNTEIGLVTRNGKCLIASTIPTNTHGRFEDYISSISKEITNLYSTYKNNYTLKGIGIGAPNGSFSLGSIVDAPNLAWKGTLPLCSEITKQVGLPAVVTNDANAAALGEMLFGSAKGMKDFIVITLGTGLGSGIVVNGKLVVGHDGFAGELGHITVEENGRLCGCGKKGCLEAYVSAPGIKKTIFKMLAYHTNPSIFRSISFENLTAKMITEEALKGDPIAREAFEYTGKILGIKLADVVATLSPEAIFFFGGLAKAGQLLFEPTKRHMEENLFPIFRNKVELLSSGLDGENTAVLGSAALIWQEL